MSGEAIYLYGLGGETQKGSVVREAAASMGIAVYDIRAEALGGTVGALIDPPSVLDLRTISAPSVGALYASARAASAVAGSEAGRIDALAEFMLMDGFAEQRMDDFLAALRERGASVGCKCSVTPTNRAWSVGTLMRQVAAEHAVMTAYMALVRDYRHADAVRSAVQASGAPTSATDAAWMELADAISLAKSLLSSAEQRPVSTYRDASVRLGRACAPFEE